MSLLFKLFKWAFFVSLVALIGTYFYKDQLPPGNYYDIEKLPIPAQHLTDRAPFTIDAGNLSYEIEPKYDYELYGVVVSYNDSEGSRWHEKMQDFINVRDLCVIWGDNVELGMQQLISFSSGSWTCYWKTSDSYAAHNFSESGYSNNHLLVEDPMVKRALMSAETGDHIRLKGSLVHYKNLKTNTARGTSIVRNDSGNGACETIFVDEFEIINKLDSATRRWHRISRWTTAISFAGFLILAGVAPVRFKN